MKLFQENIFSKIYPESEKLPFRIRSLGHFRISPDWGIQKIRYCNFVELFWAVEGKCKFIYPDGEVILSPGEVCFYDIGSLHSYCPVTENFEYYWLTFEGKMAGDFFKGFQTSCHPRYVGDCPRHLFEKLKEEVSVVNPLSVYSSLNLGIKIILAAMTPNRQELEKHPDHVAIACRLIEEKYCYPEYNIDLLAQQLHIHRSYLSRIFHKKMNCSISEYILQKRLKQAMELLRQSAFSIQEIASLSGFYDPSYFMRFFKKRTGMTPTEYRKQPEENRNCSTGFSS